MCTTRDVSDRALRRGRLLAARSRPVRSINRRGILGGSWDMGSVVRGFMSPVATAGDELAADSARGDPANQFYDQPTEGDEA